MHCKLYESKLHHATRLKSLYKLTSIAFSASYNLVYLGYIYSTPTLEGTDKFGLRSAEVNVFPISEQCIVLFWVARVG